MTSSVNTHCFTAGLGLALLALLAHPTSIAHAQQTGNCGPIPQALATLAGDEATFTASVILPTDTNAYTNATKQFATPSFPNRTRPSFIVQAKTEQDVQTAVRFAGQCGYTVSARSGGHSYLGLSSCDSANGPCIQIDLKQLNHTSFSADKILSFGPGVTLEEMGEFLLSTGTHLPSGECSSVRVGGHVQTGGFGLWGRPLGTLASRAVGFRIVLADGTLMEVVPPAFNTSKTNDDLFYAVRGGASGSWGVLTEVSFNPYLVDELFSVFWVAGFLWDSDGAANMYRTYAELAKPIINDNRWTVSITVNGDAANPGSANQIFLEMAWVGPLAQAGDYDPSFFQSILDACTGCVQFLAIPNAIEPLSASLNYKFIKQSSPYGGDAFSILDQYNWQQSTHFPTPDEAERLARLVEANLPAPGGDFRFVSQLTTGNFPNPDSFKLALPWPDDIVGIASFFYYGNRNQTADFKARKENVTEVVIDILGGQNHRMYWAANGNISFPRDAGVYFDSSAKFERLRDIKGCVDPGNMFDSMMSIPLPDTTPTCEYPVEQIQEVRVTCGSVVESTIPDAIVSFAEEGIFEGNVILPSNMTGYYEASRQFASPYFPDRIRPSFIVEAATERDVQAAVRFAGQCGYTVSARSGGHSYLGLSSCDSSKRPCLQIDVKKLNQTSFSQQAGLAFGPGITLEEMGQVLLATGTHLPSGECSSVRIGGHMQTGGFGLWGRPLGTLAARAVGFRIVLADGSVMQVIPPIDNGQAGTSKLNDDLYYAVRGGASGSWGVLTEISFNPYIVEDYFSVFWVIGFVWNGEGAANMYRKYAELAGANINDNRWTVSITVSGDEATEASAFNRIFLEMAWVGPVAEADDYDPSFFQSIIDACTNCVQFLSLPDSAEPLSVSLNFKFIKPSSPYGGAPFPIQDQYSWQQSTHFPTPDEAERLARLVDENLPTAADDFRFVSQMTTGNFPSADSHKLALPWADDIVGIASFWFYGNPSRIEQIQATRDNVTDQVIDILGGQNHEMYWGAYGNVSFPRDSARFFESEAKFARLQDIKACVDPNNLFESMMTIPLPDSLPTSCEYPSQAATIRAVVGGVVGGVVGLIFVVALCLGLSKPRQSSKAKQKEVGDPSDKVGVESAI